MLLYTRIRARTYTHTRTHSNTYTQIFTQIHAHAHTHRHTRIHTHTHISTFLQQTHMQLTNTDVYIHSDEGRKIYGAHLLRRVASVSEEIYGIPNIERTLENQAGGTLFGRRMSCNLPNVTLDYGPRDGTRPFAELKTIISSSAVLEQSSPETASCCCLLLFSLLLKTPAVCKLSPFHKYFDYTALQACI